MILQITDQEYHTILAALRFYQNSGQGDPANRSDAIHDIATNMGDVTSLDEEGIDKLTEKINDQKVKLWVAIWDNKYGLDIYLAEEHETNIREILKDIDWPEEIEKPADPEEAVERYFEYNNMTDFLVIDHIEVTK